MTICAMSLLQRTFRHGCFCASAIVCVMQVFHASPKLAAVGSVDEAVVIGAALALSSSAFVLQLMSERGELATKFGSATLGILLLQVCMGSWLVHYSGGCI